MSIGARLREARRERKMTVAAVAQASHLSKGFISQVEQGHSRPSLASLQRITSSLGVSLAFIIEGNPEPPDAPTAPQSRPQAYRRVDLQKASPSITVVNEGIAGSASCLSLAPGTLSSGAASPESGAKGVCFVLKGMAKFSQREFTLDLSESDALTWDVSQPYNFSNMSDGPAVLCLFLPGSCSVPQISTLRQVAPPRELPLATRTADQGGPLRLVAMRAHRSEVRSR